MDLYPRQEELLAFLDAKVLAEEEGLVEKSRDIGFTWTVGGWALHKWIYVPGFKTKFGSRIEAYVDKLGDPDSIFEKIRMIYKNLPAPMMPVGFDPKKHDNHMRLVNPVNGNLIGGEAGTEMGRGGRSTAYIVDEAAFVERAERVDAAISSNANCRIWASTVNGMGNAFANKRFGGSLREDQIFTYHWSDDPRKTPEWAAKRKGEMEAWAWASEYEIDYSASVEGVCIPALWVNASIRLNSLIQVEPDRDGIAGLDVGGGGKAKSVYSARFGPVVCPPISWGDGDTTATANRALDEADKVYATREDKWDCTVKAIHYDSVGVGKGVQSTLKNAQRAARTFPINSGDAPSTTRWPNGQTSVDQFFNLKAEMWFLAREKLRAAYELALFLEGKEEGVNHPVSDVVILPPPTTGKDSQLLATQLSLPKWFKTEKGKIIMEKKDQLATRGIASPDHAEAFVLTFARNSNLSTWANL